MVRPAVELWTWFLVSGLIEVFMSGISTGYIDSCARGLGGKQLSIQFPWENTQFEQFLSRKPRPIIKPPDWVTEPFDDVLDSAGRDNLPKPTRLNKFNIRRHMSDVSWVASENRRLNLALQCWKVIVLDSTTNTELGRVLTQCIELGRGDDYVWQVLVDAFSGKAAATLKSRAASLLAFGRWRRSLTFGSSASIFPISEELAYEYVCELRCMKAAPSKSKRFLEALGFAKGLVGAKVDEVLSSSRVKGAASGTSASPPKKKSPFTVEQLLVLERIAMYGQGQDAIFSGYICFLVHCRLRWSDGQHCIQEPVLDVHEDRGFIEAALYHHKTARKRRTHVLRLLPVAGVIPGVSGQNWAVHWLQKRLESNLRGSMRQPMMPSPCPDGTWAQQPLTSSEANLWLRELLGPWTEGPLKDLATHSAKATVLAWLAKANVDIALRRLAGYHVTPGDKSALEYSRDAAAPVLRQIEAAIISIRAGIFNPDVPRSQRWSGAYTLDEAVKHAASILKSHVKPQKRKRVSSSALLKFDLNTTLDEEPQPDGASLGEELPSFHDDVTLAELKELTLKQLESQQIVSELENASDVSDTHESVESSTDCDSGSDDADRQVLINGEKNAKDLVAPSDLASKICFRHVKSQKLHFVERSNGDVRIFRCGRKCNENYERLETVPAFAARGCMSCFGWNDKKSEVSDPESD